MNESMTTDNAHDFAATIKSASKEIRSLLTRVKDLRESVVKTEQRALTGPKLEAAIWKIWGHCRANQNSLDSERHCKVVKEIVDNAVSDATNRAEELAVRLDASEAANKQLKKDLKAAAKANESLMAEITGHKASEAELTATLRRWVASADAGELDGVELQLLAESEAAIEDGGDEILH